MSSTFPQKHPGESFAVEFDFSAHGAAVTGATVAVSAIIGADPNPSSLLSGASQIEGAVVRQRVASGLPGVHYLMTVTATDGTDTWVLEQILPVGGITN